MTGNIHIRLHQAFFFRMEGKNTWHGKAVDDESYKEAMIELGGAN